MGSVRRHRVSIRDPLAAADAFLELEAPIRVVFFERVAPLQRLRERDDRVASLRCADTFAKTCEGLVQSGFTEGALTATTMALPREPSRLIRRGERVGIATIEELPY